MPAPMTLDVGRTRRDTPGCEEVLHFNNAGSSLMPDPVLRATVGHLELEARIGGYEAAARKVESLERVYGAAGRMIGCDQDEIAIVENATRAWDMAFYSIPFGPGDRILTAQAEYASNYIACLQVARKTGAVVVPVPSDDHGRASVSSLRDMMDERVKPIAITHVPTNGGLLNPAKEVGKVAREAGCLYLLDACQSAGQMPLDVGEIGCEMLSATGRKYLRGPRGTSFLYVRRGVLERLEPPFLDLHAAEWTARDRFEIRPDARRFENWETNFAGKVGLGVAIDYALDIGLEAIRERVYDLTLATRALWQRIDLSEKTIDRANLAYFMQALAAVAALQGEASRSATLIGAAEGALREGGAPVYNFYVPDPSLPWNAQRPKPASPWTIQHSKRRAPGERP